MYKDGIVIRGLASFYYVKIDDELIECRASKKLKLNKESLIIGDDVIVEIEKNYIIGIKERKNVLIRPKVANIDGGALVFSATEPKISYNLLDRMIIPMEQNHIYSIIIITKTDLLSQMEIDSLRANMEYYEKIGYKVFYSNEYDSYELLKKQIRNQRIVFTGQTGVGKSTLINKICPFLDLKTQEISKSLGRGKHTTREVTFYEIESGFIIDTPGFSSIDAPITDKIVRDNYIDFVELSNKCKFSTCFHLDEPQCNIKRMLEEGKIPASRYNGYKKLINNIREKR